MAAQQCRESRYFHGIICCYIGFAFFSPCKFQRGNPSRRCAMQGSLWAGLAACCHAFLARSPDDPDPGAASPKAVRQRTLFSCRERKYISPQLQWIASERGNGTGKIENIFEQMGQWFQKIFIIERIESKLFFYVRGVIKLIAYLFMS